MDGRDVCAARGGGGGEGEVFATDGSKAVATATASDFFKRAERACLRVRFGCRAWEGEHERRRGRLPPPRLPPSSQLF